MKDRRPGGHRRHAPAAGVLLLGAAIGSSLAAAELSPDERRRLAAGETVVRLAPAPAPAGWAARVLEAPAERVARAVGDWRHYDEFFPFVESSEVRVEKGLVITRQVVDPPHLLPRHRVDAVVTQESGTGADGRRWQFSWRALDLDHTEESGAWRIVELSPGRARVELHLVARLGLMPALERRAVERTLPWVLDGLAQHVGRCRYDRPRHPTCEEAPAFVAPAPAAAP